MTREEHIIYVENLRTALRKMDCFSTETMESLDMAIKEMKQESKTWSLDDAREDFTHDVYNTLDFLPTNNEANRIIDSFDRVTKGIKQEPILDRDCEHCSKTYGTLGCCTTVSNKWVYSCKIGQKEYILDKIRAEIEKQEIWLMQAGYNAYNADIAFNSIKSVLAESER